MVLPIGCPYEAASLLMKGGKIDNLPERTVATVIRSTESDCRAGVHERHQSP